MVVTAVPGLSAATMRDTVPFFAVDGKAIIALPSTAKKGTVSRIVAALSPGTAVTTMRADVDYIVTEHGVAHLRGMGLRERAEALIEIANPAFRDQIREEAATVYGPGRLTQRGLHAVDRAAAGYAGAGDERLGRPVDADLGIHGFSLLRWSA